MLARGFEFPNPPATVADTIAKLKPLHRKLGKPEPGEWLDRHKERGQSFRQYCRIQPATPTGRRTTIYVQPIGDFSDSQRRIVELSAEYVGVYFNRSVKILADLPITAIPAKAQRVHPEWKVKQILTTYVLDELLASRLPADAAVYIGFTASDQWPGDHQEESDKHPLYLCPECHAKVCWATGADPRTRFGHLAKFCETHGLAREREYFKQAQNALK